MEDNSRPLVITVSGEGEETYPPERCTISITVSVESESAEESGDTASATVRELTQLVTEQFDSENGPINWWSLDQVRHSRHRPYNRDGIQLPYVYRATAELDVKFNLFDAIEKFVKDASVLEGVQIGHFDWALTKKSYRDRITHVRELAVRDAQSKAETYARTVGRNRIDPVEIADPGLLGTRTRSELAPMSARGFVGSAPDDGIELKPEHITLSAQVHAKFEAR
ncbi:SIMPL domain-containing protein [Rhodococcus sp. NPDC058521]|uniref:SIMPL domain-containing protein n=1 Tax=Rhodococcus sp. NPDC058521 TaxID=3346536 RepID=UPI003665A892